MNLSEIIKAVEERNIPDSIAEKTEWISALNSHSKKVAPISSCLIFSAKENNFKGEESEWMHWALNKFKFASKSYVHKCHHVGKVLLESDEKTFVKLAALAFEKLYDMRELGPLLPSFIQKNDVDRMTRDEVREAVKKALGEEPKEKEEKSKFWKAVEVIAKSKTPEIFTAVKDATETDLVNGTKAALTLTAACIEKLKSYPDDKIDPQYLKRMEAFLQEQMKDIAEMKFRAARIAVRETAITREQVAS